MKRIQQLFKELESLTKNEDRVFDESGMKNKYDELDFGFFPLGQGVFDKDKKPETLKVMILGNDFGTESYLTTKCIHERREPESNPTIRNLRHLNLEPKTTFYTNFYLGVRSGGSNIEKVVPVRKDFQELCWRFFLKQLTIVKPSIVICLGHAVRKALSQNSDDFIKWRKSRTHTELYDTDEHLLDVSIENKLVKFIVIPHPCDRRNFKEKHISQIQEMLS